MKRAITLGLGLAISIGAIYILIRGDIAVLQDEIRGGQYGYVLPASVFFVLALVTRGIRWRALLGYRTSSWHAFHIMNVGYLLNNLPLRIGELARAWMATRLKPPIAFFTAFSSIAVERVLDLLMVLIMLGVSLVVLDVPREVSAGGATLSVITLIAAGLMVYFAYQRPKAHQFLAFVLRILPFLAKLNLSQWLDHFLDGLQPLTSAKVRAEAIFWTVISWALSVITGYILLFVFFPESSLAGSMLLVVMLALAIAIPSVPGNLGTFEAAGVTALWIAGLVASVEAPANAPALAFAVLLHMINIIGYVILGMAGLYIEQTSLGQLRRGLSQESGAAAD